METEGTPGYARAPVATGWVGWIWFAALLLITAGFVNLIHGFAAVVEHEAFGGADALLGPDLTAWGWVHAIAGALQLVIGVALLYGVRWSRFAAIVLVLLNVLAQFASLNANPAWAAIVIALDLIVLWALVVHGAEARGGIAA